MMKQFLYSLILFSAVFSEVYAKNIDSLRNVFEQSEQLDSSYYKAYSELIHHYIKSNQCSTIRRRVTGHATSTEIFITEVNLIMMCDVYSYTFSVLFY